VCQALRVQDFHLVATCTTPTGRGIEASVLADAVRQAGGTAEAVNDPEAALDSLFGQCDDDDLIVIAGSTVTIGILRPVVAEL